MGRPSAGLGRRLAPRESGRDAPPRARLVKLADRASNVQTLRNLAPDRQRSYFAQTVTRIVSLAGTEPWFAGWYAAWQRDFADLA
jgi:GTP pyrophosphokinase